MLKELQDYYNREGYNVVVIEAIPFNGFSILKCKEWHPIGEPWTEFEIIAQDGKFYNQNFDDIVEINKSIKGE